MSSASYRYPVQRQPYNQHQYQGQPMYQSPSQQAQPQHQIRSTQFGDGAPHDQAQISRQTQSQYALNYGQTTLISLTSNHRPIQFHCLYPQCANNQIKFSRKADLQRHCLVVHNREQLELVDCQFPGCHRRGGFGFTRQDKMIDHMRDVHKEPIPKRKSSKDSGRSATSPTSSIGSSSS